MRSTPTHGARAAAVVDMVPTLGARPDRESGQRRHRFVRRQTRFRTPGPAYRRDVETACDLVLPCRDEAAALLGLLPQVPGGLRVVVVDNGSPDGTAEVARRLGATVVDEPVPGYGAAVHAGLLAATGDLRRVHGRRRLLRRRATCCRCSTTSAPAAPTWPSAAAARSPAASGRGTRGSATTWSSGGCAAGSGWPPTTSRRCGSAAATALLALDVRDRRFGYPVELLQKATAAGWRVAERDVAYHPRAAGHPVEGVRLGARHGARGPRLLAGARVTPYVLVVAKAPEPGPGEDPARGRDRHGARRRDRRRLAARHAGRLRPPPSAPDAATSRSTATSTAPSAAPSSGRPLAGLDRPPAARRATSAPGWPTPTPGCRARSCRSAWTPRRSRADLLLAAAAGLRRARRGARPRRGRRLVGARAPRPAPRVGAVATCRCRRRRPAPTPGPPWPRPASTSARRRPCATSTRWPTPTRWPRLAPGSRFAAAWGLVTA